MIKVNGVSRAQGAFPYSDKHSLKMPAKLSGVLFPAYSDAKSASPVPAYIQSIL
jgi:hypothetical protein